jgi:hypothetical protein
MSKTKVSASALGLPSRRLFLAFGPAAVVLTSLRKAAADESPIAAAIQRHLAAFESYDAACDWDARMFSDDPRRPGMSDEFSRLSDAEDSALEAVCACHVKSASEARAKVDYLADYFERVAAPTESQIDALLRSLVA